METGNIVYKGTIKGKFQGFKNTSTKFEFCDGQVWRQNETKFVNRFKFGPEVIIVFRDNKYIMEVHGVDETVEVKRVK